MSQHANLPTPWTLLSLRPRGQHGPLRQLARAGGGRLLALSPWAIVPRTDQTARLQLQRALSCPQVLFTSPAAVQAANTLLPLAQATTTTTTQWLAVGAGTAAALRAAGVPEVQAPARMDSEGLLDLPGLRAPAGQQIGMVSAPGGRGIIASTLLQRGANLALAEVYTRVPLRLRGRQRARLNHLPAHSVLALSSGKALEQLWAQLTAHQQQQLCQATVVAASERLAQQARTLGFARVHQARSAMPADLLACWQAEPPASPGENLRPARPEVMLAAQAAPAPSFGSDVS